MDKYQTNVDLYLLAKDSQLLIAPGAAIAVGFGLWFAQDDLLPWLLLWGCRLLLASVLLLGHRGSLLDLLRLTRSTSIITLHSLLIACRLVWNIGQRLLLHQLVRNSRRLLLICLHRCLHSALNLRVLLRGTWYRLCIVLLHWVLTCVQSRQSNFTNRALDGLLIATSHRRCLIIRHLLASLTTWFQERSFRLDALLFFPSLHTIAPHICAMLMLANEADILRLWDATPDNLATSDHCATICRVHCIILGDRHLRELLDELSLLYDAAMPLAMPRAVIFLHGMTAWMRVLILAYLMVGRNDPIHYSLLLLIRTGIWDDLLCRILLLFLS